MGSDHKIQWEIAHDYRFFSASLPLDEEFAIAYIFRAVIMWCIAGDYIMVGIVHSSVCTYICSICGDNSKKIAITLHPVYNYYQIAMQWRVLSKSAKFSGLELHPLDCDRPWTDLSIFLFSLTYTRLNNEWMLLTVDVGLKKWCNRSTS